MTNETITTAQLFTMLNSLESARECRMYRVTLGSGRVSRIAARSILDAHKRAREASPGSVILGIDELPKGDIS